VLLDHALGKRDGLIVGGEQHFQPRLLAGEREISIWEPIKVDRKGP
jgi:hypothetical protein